MRSMKAIGIACVIATSVGCQTLPEGSRQLVDQIVKASGFVLNGVVFGPAQVQAMMDIQKNAEVLLANHGAPNDPKPYSPKASEEARKKAVEEHQNPWWMVVITALSGIGVGGMAARALVTVFPSIFAGPVGTALKSLVEGITTVRQQAEAQPDKKFTVDEMLGTLMASQEKHGVREYVRAEAKESETRIKKLRPEWKPPAS